MNREGPGQTRVTVARAAGAEAEWEALAQRTGSPPFLRPGWIRAWVEAFAPGSLELLVARREGEAVGFLALRRRSGVVASPTNWHTPEFGPVAVDAEASRALVAAALRRARRRVDLSFLPRAGMAEDLATGVGGEARVLIRTIERSPWVDLSGSWEEYEAGLPAKRRADLRRRSRRLGEEAGPVEFSRHGTAEGLDDLLAEGFAVEASGWKGTQGTAIRADARVRRFYESAAHWAAEAGCLSLNFLRAGGRPVAFAYCIAEPEAHHVLKIGIDPAFNRFAPGLLLTREMIRAAFADGRRRYEFLGQDDPYKLIWTDRLHLRERLQLFPRGPLGATEALAWRRGRPLLKRLAQR